MITLPIWLVTPFLVTGLAICGWALLWARSIDRKVDRLLIRIDIDRERWMEAIGHMQSHEDHLARDIGKARDRHLAEIQLLTLICAKLDIAIPGMQISSLERD